MSLTAWTEAAAAADSPEDATPKKLAIRFWSDSSRSGDTLTQGTCKAWLISIVLTMASTSPILMPADSLYEYVPTASTWGKTTAIRRFNMAEVPRPEPHTIATRLRRGACGGISPLPIWSII
ncbi:hypothetical protein D1872_274260 [compost metagenome]